MFGSCVHSISHYPKLLIDVHLIGTLLVELSPPTFDLHFSFSLWYVLQKKRITKTNVALQGPNTAH